MSVTDTLVPVGDQFTAKLTAQRQDIAALQGLMQHGAHPGNEDCERDAHLNQLITKPWGYEYRVYADDLFDLWQLCLRPGQRTSMHAHPRKTTYLLCLRGLAWIEGFRDRVEVRAGDLVRIQPGSFHRTTNVTATDEDLHLIEVEMPRNKLDLVRLQDDYDRVGKGYETTGTELHTVYKRVPYIPGAFMCRTSACGTFNYAVNSGMDLYYRGIGPLEFHVPIGIRPFLEPDLSILRAGATASAQPECYYLSVLPQILVHHQ